MSGVAKSTISKIFAFYAHACFDIFIVSSNYPDSWIGLNTTALKNGTQI